MNSVGKYRLYFLRAMYLLLAVGLDFSIWPSIIFPSVLAADSKTVVRALLGAIGLFSLLGLRYPLLMLPLLLFELLWKSIWLVAFALPLWLNNALDANAASNAFECMAGVVLVILVTPWSYVLQNYIWAPSERSNPNPIVQRAARDA